MKEEFEGLSLAELINLLAEVPEPPPVSMLPQTPGWVVVGLIVGGILFAAARGIRRRWHANAYRRSALDALEHAGDDPAKIAAILRRAALVAFPRSEVVPMAGETWLAFLDQTYPGAEFQQGAGQVLATAPYRAQSSAPDLRRVAKEWIRQHKADRL